jgi:uncharacterized membrane protein YgcG
VENLLEAMPSVSETQMLTIFKGVVDDASVEKLEGEQFRDADLTYEEFFATMDLEFGGEDHANMRAKWYNLRVRHAGSLKLRDWRSFSAPFFKLMAMVEDATEEEAERLMLKALPVEWRRKVEIEVSKRNREGQMVVEGLPFHMDEAMVQQFVTTETGVQPKRVRVIAPGKWKIQGADEEHRREIMKLNRQRLEGGARITIKLVEDRLTVKDIDMLMRRWLHVDDRVNQVMRGDRGDDRGRRDDRPRFTREVTAEDTESEEGVIAAVSEYGKGKPRPRSAESHPRKGKEVEKKMEEKEVEKKPEMPEAASACAAPTTGTPPGPRGAVPQWTPEAQWWYHNQWAPAYWTPEWAAPTWTPHGAGYKGSYGAADGGSGGDEWRGRKGDKGGGGGGGKSKGGKGGGGDNRALSGGRGKAGVRN